MARLLLLAGLVALAGCQKPWPFLNDRYAKIPEDAQKGSPATDPFPPVLVSGEYEAPIPMAGPVNSAGAEDSPFISGDGTEFFFFFTPDVRVPVERQLADSVTGIWQSRLSAGAWAEPERVVLSNDVSLDGCAQLVGDTLWFGSVRAGALGEIDVFTAIRRNGEWRDWRNAGTQLNVDYDVGEFHLAGHETLYFGRADSSGNSTLWWTGRTADSWSEPVSLGPGVNCLKSQFQPFVSSNGRELWFTGWCDTILGPSVYRSIRAETGEWQAPELVVARFAAEPTLDDSGNLYFVHHYYTEGDSSRMQEADIYFCRRKTD